MSLLLAPHYTGGGVVNLGAFQDGFDAGSFGYHFCRVELRSDGTIYERHGAGDNFIGNWLIGGDASLYEYRATYVGDNPGGILYTWTNAGAGMAYGVTSNESSTVTLEFRLASDHSSVGFGTVDVDCGGF